MYQAPAAPAGIGGVLDDGFRLFRTCFVDCLPFLVIMAIVGIVPSLVLPSGAELAENPDLLAELIGPGLIIGYLVMIVVQAFCFGGSVAAIQRRVADAQPSLAASFATALSRLPWLVVAGFLYSIALFIGFMLLVIPGLWVSLAMLFFGYCCVADKDGPVQSLRSSLQLVKGNWWRTAALVTVATVLVLVIYVLVMFVVGLVVGVTFATGDGNPEALASLDTNPVVLGVSALIAMPVFMLMIAMQYAVYADLKLRRQGADLDSRIAEV